MVSQVTREGSTLVWRRGVTKEQAWSAWTRLGSKVRAQFLGVCCERSWKPEMHLEKSKSSHLAISQRQGSCGILDGNIAQSRSTALDNCRLSAIAHALNNSKPAFNMAQPVLVRSYSSNKPTPTGSPSGRSRTLPPIASFAFADILRQADGPEMQSAIDGIAEICAKNRMSLAEEYASHMPPVGEITAVSTLPVGGRLHPGRQAPRRALTSVPEVSSSGSEGSKKGRRRSIFASWKKDDVKTGSRRVIRIGSMGRTVIVDGTTAISGTEDDMSKASTGSVRPVAMPRLRTRARSTAAASLQRLLDTKNVFAG